MLHGTGLFLRLALILCCFIVPVLFLAWLVQFSGFCSATRRHVPDRSSQGGRKGKVRRINSIVHSDCVPAGTVVLAGCSQF